ncbi:MAG: GNAT family N-acetyltransferase [Gammaproteobacteria bacterium]
MLARTFNERYCEDITLPDGGVMRLRLVRPGDREGIIEAFDSLSTESRVQRWFYPKMRLSEAEIASLISPADDNHGAISAVELDADGNEKAGIGMARFVLSKESEDAAEIAITIVDEWQGLGIGRILLHRLLAMISERGIPYVDGRLQADNGRMRHLLEPYVPQGGFRREDSNLAFRFPVPAADDPLMAQLARNAAAVIGMFKRMAEGAIVLPLALAEQRLQSLGPKALLQELRRQDAGTDARRGKASQDKARPKKNAPANRGVD